MPLRKSKQPHPRTRSLELERFSARLTARLCIIFIALSQIGLKVLFIILQPSLTKDSKISYATSMPFMFAISIIVVVEYVLFKKKGPRIVKYSHLVDALFFILFTAEWLSSLFAALIKASGTHPPSYSVTAVFGFTAFSWRTLIQPFITHHWQIKIIPPVSALALVIGFAIHFDPSQVFFSLARGFLQIFYIIMLFFFEDRIRLRIMLTTMQQEKWVQINEFILNNIPENIMILDLDGQAKFINDYCKSFIEKCNCTTESTQDFFTKITEIQQQAEPEPSSPSLSRTQSERLTTMTGIVFDQVDFSKIFTHKIDTLQDLISNFKTLITEKILQERSFLIYNAKLHKPNSQEKSIEIKISFIQQHGKDYIILILRDTTQRDLLITLEDNNKYKDHLLASVSHELRAPLNGNINLVETAIQAKDVPQTVKETLLTPALRSSKFLLNLINDILDMSQIKAQKLRLAFQSANLFDTLANTMQLVELQAKKKGVEMKFTVEPDTPENFCTDHVRLSQIVLNLLNNALKFTPEGVINLKASPVEGLPWVNISVEDSGIGMSRENVKKLFSTFTHIDFKGREVLNPSGVGLGLNIAYNLVGLLGPKEHNKIEVTSIPNHGSVFSFIIESKEVGLQIQDQSDKGISEESLMVPDEVHIVKDSGLMTRVQSCFMTKCISSLNYKHQNSVIRCVCPKVLVVDDNPFNIMAFETILVSLDIKCEFAYNGKSALEKIVNRLRYSCCEYCKPFVVIFMDQEMPGMSGSDTVKEIRELQAQNLVPSIDIIGCTAHGSKEEVEKFMESGINCCIQKPISVTQIQRILHPYEEL